MTSFPSASADDGADAPRPAYASTADWPTLAARLRGAARVALVTHRKPDGDAIGSLVAVSRMLRRLGVGSDALVMGGIEPAVAGLAREVPLLPVTGESPPIETPDVILVVDTGAWGQLEPLGPWLREHADRVIGVDHHARGDDVAPVRVVDVASASTTQMLMHLAAALDVPLDRDIAEALFLGLATDTGWFRHSNADAAAFRAASDLLAVGVDKAGLYQTVEETHRPARLALAARALSSLTLHRDGEVAIQTIRQTDFAETGGSQEDLVGLVNVPMTVGTIRVAIFATESPGDRPTKFSFRGKPGGAGWADADVNELAGRFDGGGHRFAAGARIPAPLEAAIAQVVETVEGRPSLRRPDEA